MLQLLAELPSSCRALALDGDAAEALAALDDTCGPAQHSELGGASVLSLMCGVYYG